LKTRSASPKVNESSLSPKAAGMAQAALLIAAGNITSRLLGLARETVIAQLFGASGLVSAFRIAQIIPTMLYDLLVGGMISSALVPVFSEQAERDRQTLWYLASLILSLIIVGMGIVVLLIELAAPQVAFLLASGFDQELLDPTTRLLRITTPAVLFLSVAGIMTGLLHALKRFTWPAFTATLFNATIVIVALVGTSALGWGIESLAIGLLLGALLQVILQLPGLRDAQFRFTLELRHPILHRMGKLGLPIILGLVISQVAIVLDRNLASWTGEQSIAWMQFATTIIQFPLGLISAAISLAILPTLSRLASEPEGLSPFIETLSMGLRLVLVLIIPATVALFILAPPVVALLFERGQFTAFDTQQTTLALRLYLIGLPFAAIDQPLIFAFYARQNTLTPALVGLLGVGFYLVAALAPLLFRPLQMTDLVLANSIQLMGHALVMLWLVHRVASLRHQRLGLTLLKALGGASLMGLCLVWSAVFWQNLFPTNGFIAQVCRLALLIILGSGAYLISLILLKGEELQLLLPIFRRFFLKRK
jgi:putative peptidoglycan lipid II flippase